MSRKDTLSSLLLEPRVHKRPRATVGIPSASGLQRACNVLDARPTSSRPSAAGSRPNPSPSTAGRRRPSMIAGSQP
eukprot:2998755-Pleurochrysis_carterae.AAC.1